LKRRLRYPVSVSDFSRRSARERGKHDQFSEPQPFNGLVMLIVASLISRILYPSRE
jgi:hypothetical protein